MSELHASMKLGRYLESKNGNGDLVVFSCVEVMFGDIFKDIFK